MVNPASTDGTGSTTLSQITVDNDDFFGICSDALAYTDNAQPADGANDATPLKMHFCSGALNAFNFPDLSAVSCDSLGTTLSTAMQTLGGYALVHELRYVVLCFFPFCQQD